MLLSQVSDSHKSPHSRQHFPIKPGLTLGSGTLLPLVRGTPICSLYLFIQLQGINSLITLPNCDERRSGCIVSQFLYQSYPIECPYYSPLNAASTTTSGNSLCTLCDAPFTVSTRICGCVCPRAVISSVETAALSAGSPAIMVMLNEGDEVVGRRWVKDQGVFCCYGLS